MAEPLVLEDLRKALEARDATKFGAIAAVSASLGRSSSSTLGPIVNRALASGNADLALAAMTASHALVDSEAAKAKPVLAAFLDAPDSRFWGPASGMLCAIDSDGGKTILQAMSRFDRKSNVAAVLAAIQVIRAVAERAGDGVARKATVPALTRFLRHADVSCQKAAITALAALGPDARNAIGELEEVATELPDMEEAIKAALGRIDPSRNEAPKVEADLPPLDL
jgi:hypothetical protein